MLLELDVSFFFFANSHQRGPVSVSDVIVVEGPAFAESISEGDIRWIKRLWKYLLPWIIDFYSEAGDFVNEDELVAEIETDKVLIGFLSFFINIRFQTSVEVPAPQAGTIVEFLVEDGAKVFREIWGC